MATRPVPARGQADPLEAMREALAGFGRRLAGLEQAVSALHDLLESQAAGVTLKDWYDTNELAAALGVSQHTVQARWCSGGRIECQKDPDSGRWRIPGREFRRLTNGGALKKAK